MSVIWPHFKSVKHNPEEWKLELFNAFHFTSMSVASSRCNQALGDDMKSFSLLSVEEKKIKISVTTTMVHTTERQGKHTEK